MWHRGYSRLFRRIAQDKIQLSSTDVLIEQCGGTTEVGRSTTEVIPSGHKSKIEKPRSSAHGSEPLMGRVRSGAGMNRWWRRTLGENDSAYQLKTQPASRRTHHI